MAQRAYRKRHASTFQSLKDENRKLKEAIKAISDAAAHQNRVPAQLDLAIKNACNIAGVTNEVTLGSIHKGPSKENDPQELSNQVIASSQSLHTIQESEIARQENLYHTDYPTPRLHYGLELETDQVVRIFDMPSDVAPYLGDGMFTLGGCIYWASLAHTVSLWRKTKDGTSPSSLMNRMFDHSRHLSDHAFIVSLAEMRLEYKRKGHMEARFGDVFRHCMDNPTERHLKIIQEQTEGGMPLEWWMSPERVEEYVKKQLGTERFDFLRPAFEGHGSVDVAQRARPLIDGLARSFVCFGNGPRWNAVHVSLLVGGWLSNTDLSSNGEDIQVGLGM